MEKTPAIEGGGATLTVVDKERAGIELGQVAAQLTASIVHLRAPGAMPDGPPVV